MRHSASVLAALLITVPAVGCGASDDERVVVFAASSLTDALDELERRYERAEPGVDMVVNLGGSSTLAAQIEQGAPADVFASADIANADRVADGHSVTVFARNELVIAVEPGNPQKVRGLADLARDELVVVLASPEVPVGAYGEIVLEGAGVTAAVDSFEQNVRSVASKIALGEADVGLVYRTDVVAAGGDLDAIEIPADRNVIADYAVVAVTGTERADGLVAFLLSDEAQAVLIEQGFVAR